LNRKGYIGLLVLTLYASLSFAQQALDTVCIYDPPNRLAVPFQAGMRYQWSVGQGLIVSRPDSNVVLIDWSNASAGVHGISVFAYSDTALCPGDTSMAMIRVTAPSTALAKFPERVCEGEWVTLESSIQGSFMWKGGSRDRTISFQATSDTSTYLIALNGSCENDTVAFDIQVFDQPVAGISFLPDTVYYGDLQNLFFQGNAAPDAQIEWYLNQIYFDQGKSTRIEFLEFGKNEVLQIVSNGFCSDTVYKNVFVDHEFDTFLPNAFTPNGDGTNDIWRFKGFGFEEYEAFIYNRWGELVCRYDQNSPITGWDGTYQGQKAQAGTYVVKLEIRDQRGEMHYYNNYITLLR
jgi:gliding motility-associated-like protein